jgi:NTP pyrophosphatase (non-canonical NTP hydrolase)
VALRQQSDLTRMVAEFNEHPNSSGHRPTADLAPTLLREEHDELQEALALMDRSFTDGSLKAERALARELADVVYVAFTTAWAYGIDLDAALVEIHRAAMSKMEANVRREDGKIVKHPGFIAPDMTEAVRNAA